MANELPEGANAKGADDADVAFRAGVAEGIVEREASLDDAQALLNAAQAEGELLFAGTAGAELLDVLESRTLMGLSPEARVQAHAHMASFLADLARLRRDAGASDDALSDDAFQASLDTALRERGIDRRQLNEMEEQLFMGAPAAHKHILKYLESMPPGARLAAHIRSVDAFIMWRRLQQSSI